MTGIVVKEREHFEAAMRRFKKSVENSGIMNELRMREQYEKPTEERKRKKSAAVKRWNRQQSEHALPPKLY